MRTGSEKVYHSEEELKEQFLDDIAKGIESHVSRTLYALPKFSARLLWRVGCFIHAQQMPTLNRPTIKP